MFGVCVECRGEPIRRRGLFLELEHTPPPPAGIGAQNRTIIVVKSISLIAILALHFSLGLTFSKKLRAISIVRNSASLKF